MAYAEFLYPQNKSEQIETLVKSISIFKEKKKQRENEMNIIVNGEDGLILKTLDIKSTQLNIEYFYNDDFLQVHRDILARLKTPNDKGIVLLHGLPGTGKTTYLRYLIGEVDKRILFVSPSVAENLMDPTFIDLLIDNPNAILIIEDAENIIMDRKVNAVSSVSNLLNLSDGLLSDCLNVQIICTFNSNISTIDNALMRKGRLIARYEFGKLKIDKAQQLCEFLEKEITVKREMTLAELMNANNTDYAEQNIRPIGFRREHVLTEN
ncbi:AAA family ATPase [Haoranjiania flava]|uniref:AAA family ATPase n=1 Tax=Haoranjiania flava TaxID=1856322 RepID=A0AAE3IMN7_9BACT|nr:AAA family ATPase [Haoranjiania flava]MCU7694429.1 AAA family ATPase [Haoranjiania flava]